jgi:3-oxoacyl-[acyl-carrier protein] reductase
MDTQKTVAIVTGASQGIGRATALRIARDFSGIVLAARNAEALKEVPNTLKPMGSETLICDLDLSEVESAEMLVKTTLDRFGRIDALLNIARAVPQIDLFEMTEERARS